jgi:hypothetical protein
VIRVEPTGSRSVPWAEFVEGGLLRSYRREHDVLLKELREFIERLREELQVPYPLADRRPYVGSGRRLLVDVQDRSHLHPELCLVAIANGQTVLTAPGEEFFERVDWSGSQPAGWRPHEDSASPIRVNPLVRLVWAFLWLRATILALFSRMPAISFRFWMIMLSRVTISHPGRPPRVSSPCRAH